LHLPEPDIRNNMLELSAFLTRIKEELQLQGQALKSKELERNELEDLILDLNSYYYQSFHEQFFPLYRAELEEDIKRLYKIARDETALKEDIIKNLKRAAQMYNHVKNGLNVLKQNHELVDSLRFTTSHSQEQLLLELLYALKDTQTAMSKCLDTLKSWQSLKALPELAKCWQVYPFQSALRGLWMSWDADSNSFGRDFKRLLINLELIQKLLAKITFSDENSTENWDICLAELHKIENNLAHKKYSPSLTLWYKQHIRPQFILYAELLELSIKQRDRKRIQLAVRNFETWLRSLLYLLERVSIRSGKPEPLLLEMHLFNPPDTSLIDEIAALLTQVQENLQQLIKQHDEAAHPDFYIFSAAAGKIVNEAWPKFKSMLKETNLNDPSILNNALARMQNQFSLLEMQIDHLNTRAEDIQKIKQQYEQMLATLDSYQDLLTEMKNQLSRTLAPRNVSRQFKDMDLRVEHVPINKGELFPPACYYLLNISEDQSGRERFIEEEDGDIFIFRLDDLKDSIIPNITLREE